MTEISPRERQVGTLLASGLTQQEAGEQLGISESTVNSTARVLYAKIGIAVSKSGRCAPVVNLTHYAIAHGWVKVKGRAGRPRKAT